MLPAYTTAASALATGVKLGRLTVKLHGILVLFAASVAVRVMVTVAPGAMVVPAAGDWVTIMEPAAVQLSETTALVV